MYAIIYENAMFKYQFWSILNLGNICLFIPILRTYILYKQVWNIYDDIDQMVQDNVKCFDIKVLDNQDIYN